MKTIRINVTKKDIENGFQEDCHECAVALACKRKLNNFYVVSESCVSVGKQVSGTQFSDYKAYDLNATVQRFIKDFDDNKSYVKPFSFVLHVRNKDAKNNVK